MKFVTIFLEQVFVGTYLYILKVENGGGNDKSSYIAYSTLLLLTAVHLLTYFGIIFMTSQSQLAQNIYITAGVGFSIASLIWVLFIKEEKYIKLLEKYTNKSHCFKLAITYNIALVITFFSIISYLTIQVGMN